MSGGYSVHDYGRMFADPVRVAAYTEALRRSIRPGSIVLEVGAGVGHFSLIACRLGAARVYALEKNQALAVGREIAAANGLLDRIVFLDGDALHTELPERVDVMVSDLRGAVPLFGQHIRVVVDARTRLLRPGGVQIPQEDRLRVALVEAPGAYEETIRPWTSRPAGLDLSAGLPYVLNAARPWGVRPEWLVGPAEIWATLDYRTVVSPDVRGQLALRATRPATVHGLALWFGTTLVDGVAYEAPPWQADTAYPGLFLPFYEPVRVGDGDTVRIDLTATLALDDYLWSWTATMPTGEVRRGSTILAAALSLAHLRLQAQDATPGLRPDARVLARALTELDGRTALTEVARRLRDAFPGHFRDTSDALSRVRAIVAEHGVL